MTLTHLHSYLGYLDMLLMLYLYAECNERLCLVWLLKH